MVRSKFSLNTQEAIEHILTKRSKDETRNYVLATMCVSKHKYKDDFDDLVQDQEFGIYLESSLGINVNTHLFDDNFIFTGTCKCGMRISKSINDPHSTRSDKARYFYTSQTENDGYNIFRCKQCKKAIDKRWFKDTEMPTIVKG